MSIRTMFSSIDRIARFGLALALLSALLGALGAPAAQATAPSASQQAASAAIDSGLVGYWPFDFGNAAADLSGSGNTAAFGNGMGLTSTTAPTRFSNTAALLSQNSATSYATAPGNNIDNLQQFTIAFWLRLNSLPQRNMSLIALGSKTMIQYTSIGNGYGFGFLTQSPTFGRTIYSRGLQPGVYYHVAATYDDNGMRIYVNGQLQNTLPGLAPLVSGSGVLFSSPSAPLDGILDDVRIYNRGLSAAEIAILAFQCGGVSEIPQAECEALVDLYTATAGPQWSNHTSWLQSNTPCSWYGVLCNNGHVIVLNLPNNELNGPLLPSLANLSQLVVLNLANNHLTGGIPLQLGNLSKLQTLDLYGNQLSDLIPLALGNLASLQTLRLYNNQLRGEIPAQLANLNPHLITLDLSYNMLSAIDSALLTFLNAQQPDWAATQTVPPSNVQAAVQSPTSVALSWTPIPYTADGGYYDVLVAPQSGGVYTSVGKTANKSASGLTVSGLTPGAAYTFSIRTFTPKHGLQQSDLLSDGSDPLAIMLTSNQAPVAANDSYTTGQNTPLTVNTAQGLLANDSDPDGDPLTVAGSNTNPAHGTLALTENGSFIYTPNPGFVGTDSFTYQASDGQLRSNVATVTISVGNQPAAATITIALDVQPDSKTNFRFTGNLGTFYLDDITPSDGDAYGSSKTFTVAAGAYTVTETVPSGWVIANISCNPPANTVADLTGNQIVINAATGTNMTCTFVVQRAGQLIGGAYNDHNHNHTQNKNDEWLRGWQMQLHTNMSTQVAAQTTNQEGRAPFVNLRPGAYTICEVLQAGWYNITPGTTDATYSQPCYTVTVAPGTAIWTRFGNSTTAPASTAAVAPSDAAPFNDVIVCALPATDDAGNEVGSERDPWEEEEAASNTIFVPLVLR